jgi:hypothetical protein
VREYAARESISTSSGQNDTGLFELNFRDDRYLPFEYLGAVSRWRLELPPENNYFDLESLSDAILHLNYTSREGGPLLRKAATEAAEGKLPGDGWTFFDVRSDFSDTWQQFRDSGKARVLEFILTRNRFPYIPGKPELTVSEIVLVYEAESTCEKGCSHVEFWKEGCDPDDRQRIHCVTSEKWPEFHYGCLKTPIGPLGPGNEKRRFKLHFPTDCGKIRRVFLFARYETLFEETAGCGCCRY